MSRLDSSRIDYPFVPGAFDAWPAAAKEAARGLFLDAFLHIRAQGLVDETPKNTQVTPVDLTAFPASKPLSPWPLTMVRLRRLTLLSPFNSGWTAGNVFFKATWGVGTQVVTRCMGFWLPYSAPTPHIRRIERLASWDDGIFYDPLCSIVVDTAYQNDFLDAYYALDPAIVEAVELEPARAVWQPERMLFRLFNEERYHDPAQRVNVPVTEMWNGYQLKVEDGWNCELSYDEATGTLTINAGIGKGRGPAPYYPWDDGYKAPDVTEGLVTINGEGRNDTVKIEGVGGTLVSAAGENKLEVTLPAADPEALGSCDCGEVGNA